MLMVEKPTRQNSMGVRERKRPARRRMQKVGHSGKCSYRPSRILSGDGHRAVDPGWRARLSKLRERHGARMPFDILSRSLAKEARERAICVILSGTGADGSVGLDTAGPCAMTKPPDTVPSPVGMFPTGPFGQVFRAAPAGMSRFLPWSWPSERHEGNVARAGAEVGGCLGRGVVAAQG
jgi:hypothetical protein